MAIRYVDSSLATGFNDGTSWANAYRTLAVVSASPGDTVYISGGPSGMTQNYALPAAGYWAAPSGSAGNVITYQIGQDALHNGTAIFIADTTSGHESYPIITGTTYFIFSGDAGDGQMHFKTSGFGPTHEVFSAINHFHIAYVDASGGCASFGNYSALIGCEIDHCYINSTDIAASANDHGIKFVSCAGTTYGDAMNFHHNTILVQRLAGGAGNDGIQCSGIGYSIHDCTIKGIYNASYPSGGQHQDGMQDTGGSSYIEFYRNTIIDIVNSALYFNGYFGGFNHARVYDNIAMIMDSAILVSGTPSGFVMGVDGGASGGGGPDPQIWNDIVVFNNLCVNYGGWSSTASYGMNNASNNPSIGMTITNCYIENNIATDSATTIGGTGPGPATGAPTISNNAFRTNTQASTDWVSYVQFGGTLNNYNLQAGASALVHQGNNVQGIFVFTDRAGTTWANPPSIGPYEYSGGGGGGSTVYKRIGRYLRLFGPALIAIIPQMLSSLRRILSPKSKSIEFVDGDIITT